MMEFYFGFQEMEKIAMELEEKRKEEEEKEKQRKQVKKINIFLQILADFVVSSEKVDWNELQTRSSCWIPLLWMIYYFSAPSNESISNQGAK